MSFKKTSGDGKKLKQKIGDQTSYVAEEADHNFFLQAFEKPTQIYRYLRNRNAYSPLFLHRSLYFMKHRCRRNKSITDKRRSFQIDSLLSTVEQKSSESSNINGYRSEDINVLFTSFHHRGDTDTSHKVQVDLFLLKICHKKRKDITSPVVRTSLGKTSVPINSLTDSPPCLDPITIPSTHFSSTGGHFVHSYRILIQATCPLTASTTNTTVGSIDAEPAQKRRRSSRGLPVPPQSTPATTQSLVYSAELTVYDRHKHCDLSDGLYEIALRDPTVAVNKSSPLWCNHGDVNDKESSLEAFYRAPRLKFDLSWTPVTGVVNSSPSSPYVNKPPSAPSVDLSAPDVNQRPSDNLRSSPQRRLRIIYQFLYKNDTRQQTEARTDTTCPWCGVQCVRLYALLKHLRLSHARFNFIYVPHSKGAKINVSINDRYDGSYVGNPQDLHAHIGYAFSRKGPVRRTPVTHVIVYRPRRGGATLAEFMEGGLESAVTREIVQGHNRLYYQSETNQPIKPQDIDYDSEADNDPKWLQIKTVKMIDEFTDVNEGEKDLMKLWNLHIMKHNFVGDCQVHLACSTFVDAYGPRILAHNLGRNFILHLVNLFDFGLIRPETVQKTVAQLGRHSRTVQPS